MEEWKRQVFALIAARKMNCGAGCNCSGAEHLECVTSYFFEYRICPAHFGTVAPYGTMAYYGTMAHYSTMEHYGTIANYGRTASKNGEWRGSS